MLEFTTFYFKIEGYKINLNEVLLNILALGTTFKRDHYCITSLGIKKQGDSIVKFFLLRHPSNASKCDQTCPI